MAAQGGQPAPVYACDPALTALFTPRQPLMGHYEVCTTREPLAEDQGEALEALDAFGTAGAYKRSALVRLYGGRRVRVDRRWTASGGRFESVTRLSPYPDASLTRLWPGTMEIRFTIDGTGSKPVKKSMQWVVLEGRMGLAGFSGAGSVDAATIIRS